MLLPKEVFDKIDSEQLKDEHLRIRWTVKSGQEKISLEGELGSINPLSGVSPGNKGVYVRSCLVLDISPLPIKNIEGVAELGIVSRGKYTALLFEDGRFYRQEMNGRMNGK